jgi:Flp pilus assembly protein TadD
MTRALHAIAFALVLGLALHAAAATSQEDALAALRAAVASHPDDPDLSWALAQALEAVGRYDLAADQMQRHLARWPERPSNGFAALGRCAYRAGRTDEAAKALERALAKDPRDAEAQLYYGMTLQALHEPQRAESHLETAASLDRELAGEALLLSGMSRLARGDTHGGNTLLAEVIERAPRSDSASDARALLGDEPPPRTASSFHAEAYAGAGYDSNVTLGGEGDLPGAGAKADALFETGTELSWRPSLGGEGRFVELGVHYDRLDYAEQTDYAAQRFLGTGAAQIALGPRAALHLDGAFGYSLLANDPYLMNGSLRPSLLVALGRHAGLLRLHASGERLAYDEDPVFESLKRSGWTYGGGLEHLVPFAGEREGWFVWGGSYERRETDATRDLLRFRGAYDGDCWRAALGAALTLPFEIHARAEVSFDAELYDHRNVVDALTENPTSPDRRRDYVWGTSLTLRRQLFRGIDVEIHTDFTDRSSNVDLYSYQRSVTGLRLRAALP